MSDTPTAVCSACGARLEATGGWQGSVGHRDRLDAPMAQKSLDFKCPQCGRMYAMNNVTGAVREVKS